MPFKHILFPVDFSKQCQAIRPVVQEMAHHYGAKLTLLHSMEIFTGWYGVEGLSWETLDIPGLKRDIRDQLATFLEPRGSAIPLETVVDEGDPGECITRFAEQNGVDLIMMPTHGYGAFRGLLLGSVTAKVLHDTKCPVWTAAHTGNPDLSGRFPTGNFLCAIDLAPESVAIIRYAAELAKDFSAKLRLVYATGNNPLGPPRILDTDFHHFLLQAGRDEMAALQRDAGTDLEGIVNMGNVSSVVHTAATTIGANLVIIGRGKQRETLGRLRTNAYAIIRDSPCPVLSI